MEIQIAKREAVSIEETIELTIDRDGEMYKFRAVVYETPKVKYAIEVSYMEHYHKPIQPSVKKKIQRFIYNYFNEAK